MAKGYTRENSTRKESEKQLIENTNRDHKREKGGHKMAFGLPIHELKGPGASGSSGCIHCGKKMYTGRGSDEPMEVWKH